MTVAGPHDVRYTRLLAAARLWRDDVVPGTSTSGFPAHRALVEAVAAFDGDTPQKKDCDHPRKWWVVFPDEDKSIQCGYCGTDLTPLEARVR